MWSAGSVLQCFCFVLFFSLKKERCLSCCASWWAVIYRSFLRGASGTGGGLGEWAEQILSSLVFCKHISYCQSLLAFQFVYVRASRGGLYSEIWGPSGVLDGDPKVSAVKNIL